MECPRFIKILCLAVLGVGIIAGAIYIDQAIRSERCRPLIVLTCSDSAPFSFHNGNELVGFDIDLSRIIGQRLGRTVQFEDLPLHVIFARLSMLQPDQGDMALTALGSTMERQRAVDFSVPYHSSYSVLVVRKHGQVKSEHDLIGKVLAVRRGSTQENLAFKDWLPFVGRLQVGSFEELSSVQKQRLLHGKLDAIALDSEEAQSFIADEPALHLVPLKGTERAICVALPKGSLWTRKVNQIIAELRSNGELEALERKWFAPTSALTNRAAGF